ncbi:MAG: tetraacyldisaccharide 4'-kinase [Deltaproteobacteria bacterium]|nr:tetraacyldisaccharide 4'-kinase [Deltaproteobacteria bacterium]
MLPKILLRRIEKVVFSPEEGRAKKFLLSPLTLTSFFYKQLIILRNQGYKKGLFFSYSLPIPVISVGNLTVGGTGKTPTTLYLAWLLQSQGKRVVVLSRGYKGKASQKVNVVSDGKRILLGPEEAGDEPFLLAEKLPGVPVLTGRDRGVLGEYAQRKFSSEVTILDDGFQHRKLQRDLDILLLDGQNPLGNGYLLPRGTLREPPEYLKRAHLILVTQPDKKENNEEIKRIIRTYNWSAPIFFAYYVPVALEKLKPRERIPWDYLRGRKVVALAGVVRPESFSALLTRLGSEVGNTIFYPDHHQYQSQDLDKVERDSVIVTTEKDAVKLRPISFSGREILVLHIKLKVEKEKEFQAILKKYLPLLF